LITGRARPGCQRIRARDLQAAPQLRLAAHHALIHLNELDRGNHFAAWQEPELFAAEIRAALPSLC
jgi:hypothetical protein